MGEREKKPYSDLAGKDKLRYEKEMEFYVPPPKDDDDEDDDAPAPKKKRASRATKNEIKKPQPALTFFTKENRIKVRDENPGITTDEVKKQVSKNWAALTDSQKQPFKNMAAEDKHRYQKVQNY